jgi:hypothetical protein
MRTDDPDDLGAWLKRFQSVDLAAAQLRETAATARRLAALANAADRVLPFGAEPSGFILAQRRLTRRGDAP